MTAPRTKVARRSAQDIAVIADVEDRLLPLIPVSDIDPDDEQLRSTAWFAAGTPGTGVDP